MRILLQKDWGVHRAGRVLTPGDGVGNILIRRGFATLAPPEKQGKPAKKTNKNAVQPTTNNSASSGAGEPE